MELVKNSDSVKQEINQSIIEYKKADLSTQSAIGLNLLIDNKVFNETIEIMGDTIYDKTIENYALRDQIGQVDESKVKQFTSKRKNTDTRNDRNKLILEQLSKTLSKNKAICS